MILTNEYLSYDGKFCYKQDRLYCGNVPLNDFVEKFLTDIKDNELNKIALQNLNELVPYESKLNTPVFIYSKRKLLSNFLNYKNSFNKEISEKTDIPTFISFSIKANYNPSILKLFQQNGSWASLVNKNELLLALKIGINGKNLIFNGNGKKLSEIELAIRSFCYLNVDSKFNLIQTIEVAKKLKNSNKSLNFFPVKLLIRVNQTLSAQVHQYLNTSGEASKFGVPESQIDEIIEYILENKDLVQLAGFHSHLGSTIRTLDIYRESVQNLVRLVNKTNEKYHIDTIEAINFGGGLGINYEQFANRTSVNQNNKQVNYPTPRDLALVIYENIKELKNKNIKVIVEPGRSLVADAGILLTNVLGVKKTEKKIFLLSMLQCASVLGQVFILHIIILNILNL